ncbi:hypothetical protein [Virgibacillus sp. DJP39]|uniref:hypothetical protein n=1 Tax=Virgibacillus sp. DJP39 TaxID=3409790 RepID=UPI003BB7CB91
MKGILKRSIKRKEKVLMIYINKNNQLSQQVIRAFKLDNILSVGKLRSRVGA